MYERFFDHFGLLRNPFHGSPNPKNFYSTAAHDAALAQTVFGIENRQGIMVLTGEPGTGKTTVLHYLLEWLHQHRYSTAYVFHSLVPTVDLIELILRDFGISCPSRSMSDLVTALHEWLLCRHEAGDCPVIIIDEAQALSTRALDELRMLLNLEIPGGKLVQLVLAGQTSLDEKLRHPDLVQLRQRVMFHCKLPALTLAETAGYIASRLADAGAAESAIFPQETVRDLFTYSKGIPRVVNLLCEHALLAAYAQRSDSVSQADVLQIARHFDLTGESESSLESSQAPGIGRLIPFPTLGPSATSSRFHGQQEEWLQTLAAADPSLSERPAAAIPTGAIRISRTQPRLLVYLREVGSSFLRDSRRLANSVAGWFRTQSRGAAEDAPVSLWKALASRLRWLREPVSSPRIATGTPRSAGGGQKPGYRSVENPPRGKRKRRTPRRMSA